MANFVESTWPREQWTVEHNGSSWMHHVLNLPKLLPPHLAPHCQQAGYTGRLRERHGPNWAESEWALCDDLQPPCLVFSVGIGNNWQFDLAAAQRGCEVHSFDPTPELRSKHQRNWNKYLKSGAVGGNLSFHYLGLGSTSLNIKSDYGHSGLGPVAHLDELLRRFARNRRVDVLKVDCEGCEWEELSYLAASSPDTLCSIQMLQFEWHFTEALRFGGVHAARQAMRHLRLHGFQPTAILRGGRDPRKQVRLEASLASEVSLLSKDGREGSLLQGVCCYTVHLRRLRERETQRPTSCSAG